MSNKTLINTYILPFVVLGVNVSGFNLFKMISFPQNNENQIELVFCNPKMRKE